MEEVMIPSGTAVTLLDMSPELLCHILQYLPLHEVLSLSMLCRKLFTAVGMYLRLCKSIDFCEGKMYGYMPSSITDDHMHALFRKCPHVEYVYGLHPKRVERRRLRRRSALTVPGIIESLSLCGNLKAVEISDLRLLEAVIQHLPQLEIIGNFQNRDGVFPPHASHRLKLQPYPRIFSLHLVGVEVPELTAMPHLEQLHLHCVRFTKLQPFRGFLAQHLKSFVMKHCMGPSMSLRYLSLIIALSSAPSLTRLELVRVPLPGGLFQRAIEDSYRHNGFVNLKHLVISGCKGVLESDLGHLMIVSSKNLESISIQPSLTRDSLFVSLSFAHCSFPKLKSLHLGFIDKLSISGDWSNDRLLTLGLAEVPDTPSSLTDSGMKIVVELFPKLRSLEVSNCPHLMAMDQWCNSLGEATLQELRDLTLQHCHCIQLPSFALFLAFLPRVEVVVLNDMFREPPKGCSHVGLSAGTGLGMSSAVVSNQDEHVAVNGNQQDFDDRDNDEAMDVDNEANQEPPFMVLPQEFFDDQNNDLHPSDEEEEERSKRRFDPSQPSTSSSGLCSPRRASRRGSPPAEEDCGAFNYVSEGTQATSADIRRSHKKQSPPKRRSQRRPSTSISAREEHRRQQRRKSEFGLQNKATSTSDPLMEDDAVQVLRLVSESLISLSVISCGVSDIVVDHCHHLTHLEVQACRILKRLQLLHSPNLQRLNISECPKLELDPVVLTVFCCPSLLNLLVTFEPCSKVYYPGVSEKVVFHRAAVNQSVILVHDYCGEGSFQAAFKENLIAWMATVHRMRNSAALLHTSKSESKKKRKKWEPRLKFPWGHQLRRIHGVIPGAKCKYQILTNDRLFAAAIEVMPWERGIPPPSRSLEWEAENQLLSSQFLKRIVTFYLPISHRS